MKVLSFGEEEEEEVSQPKFKKPRMKSSHFYEENPDGQPAELPPPIPNESVPPKSDTHKPTTTTTTSKATTTTSNKTSESQVTCFIYLPK